MADLSNFQPDFASRLAQLRAALDAAGIKESVVSGYRSPEYQNQMYQNHLAKQAGQPLPYPSVEAPSVVASPWRSFHNYGLAADFQLGNDADYARLASLAPQFGLTGIGPSDKGHIQMGGDLASDVAQYHLANWRPAGQPAPATGAVAYTGPTAQPSRVASVRPGTTLNSSPLDIILNAESGNRNINNTTQGTSSGQAQGYAQITAGTWTDFAPKAGVDLKKYPTPDSAPREVQLAVANTIPLNRWASSTVNAVLAKYPGLDTSKTLGEIQSAALNGSGGSTAVAGGQGASPATPAPQQALAGFQPGSPAEKSMLAAGKTLGLGQGGGQGQDKPEPMRLPSPPTAQAVGGPMMMGPGGQNTLAQRAAQNYIAQLGQDRGFATQPSLAYGGPSLAQSGLPSTVQSTIQPMPAGAATGMPGLPGTTLNSPSQLQMALMTGAMNPYDLYGGGFGAAQGYGS